MIWKTVEEYPYYEVSDNGDVRAKKTKRKMKPQVDKDGYLYVKLYDKNNNKYKHYRIHRLVLETFLGNPEDKPEVDHINKDRSDNRLENLRWVTRKENDSFVKHPYCKTSYIKRPVIQINKRGEIVGRYESMAEAQKKTGCNNSYISAVCQGKRHTCGGYYWSYQ